MYPFLTPAKRYITRSTTIRRSRRRRGLKPHYNHHQRTRFTKHPTRYDLHHPIFPSRHLGFDLGQPEPGQTSRRFPHQGKGKPFLRSSPRAFSFTSPSLTLLTTTTLSARNHNVSYHTIVPRNNRRSIQRDPPLQHRLL